MLCFEPFCLGCRLGHIRIFGTYLLYCCIFFTAEYSFADVFYYYHSPRINFRNICVVVTDGNIPPQSSSILFHRFEVHSDGNGLTCRIFSVCIYLSQFKCTSLSLIGSLCFSKFQVQTRQNPTTKPNNKEGEKRNYLANLQTR